MAEIIVSLGDVTELISEDELLERVTKFLETKTFTTARQLRAVIGISSAKAPWILRKIGWYKYSSIAWKRKDIKS